jgi:hypothetical protein
MANFKKAACVSILFAALIAESATAAPIFDSNSLSGIAAPEQNIELAQFVWGGRRFCWYDSAWRGPGWYQCGFAWRRGLGWGGARGWRGWHWSGWGRGGARGRAFHGGAHHGGVYRGGGGGHRGGGGGHRGGGGGGRGGGGRGR